MNSKITKQLPSESRQSLGKTDSRYWAERIFKPISGTGKKSPHWAMQLCFKSKRLSFGLRTGNKEAAARIARDIYTDLLTLGIDGTLAKHRPDRADDKLEAATIGAWINASTKVFDGSPATFGSYARSLRLIAGDILSVSKSKKRFAASKKSLYRAKIEEAPLSVLTPEAIQAWRIRFVAQAGKSPALQRTKKISANSLIRQARSLFSKKILKFITGVQHPNPIPFAGCEMFPRESMRYNSAIDPGALLQAANEDLAIADPDAFLTLLLAIGAGLRRGEIDKLLWRQIDFQAGTIRIEATEAGGLKSEDSAGAVPIEAEFVAILRGYYAKATGPFLIGGSSAETESRDWGHQYRCKGVFKRLNAWLRKQGVNTAKPLHTLRKEAGSLVATASGIHAASRFLRHADIQVTAMHYADHKERVTVGIGKLLRYDEFYTTNFAEITRGEDVSKASSRSK